METIARPEGLETPTIWFEVTATSLILQLEESLATLAEFARPTQLADFWFTKCHCGTDLAHVAVD